MTFDLQKIIESKNALRHELAALPIAEKLRMLDALRERAIAIHGESARFHVRRDESSSLKESPEAYTVERKDS